MEISYVAVIQKLNVPAHIADHVAKLFSKNSCVVINTNYISYIYQYNIKNNISINTLIMVTSPLARKDCYLSALESLKVHHGQNFYKSEVR